MILIVAPYSPPNRHGSVHLGASRKLEAIISVLSKLDDRLVLVNSAHNDVRASPLSCSEAIVGGVALTEITPPTCTRRGLGKLKNIFDVEKVLSTIEALGTPRFIWFYNGYAFEMRLAAKAQKRFGVPMILEFEDWHFSRGRGLNPKPYIDYLFWRLARRYMAGTFAVNQHLVGKMGTLPGPVELLPGIVPKILADIASEFPPFNKGASPIHVGFFGGLSHEKGDDVVLQLAASLPEGYVLHVTGAGPMVAKFESAANELAGRLCFYGRVDDAKLYQLISKCDVMLNPHSSIEEMNNGVFPFKVIEAIASGRLLISTAVPSQGLEDVLVGVRFVERSVDAFRDAIISAEQYYREHLPRIAQGAEIANKRFGEAAILEKIKEMAAI